jgi:hypothetical protein
MALQWRLAQKLHAAIMAKISAGSYDLAEDSILDIQTEATALNKSHARVSVRVQCRSFSPTQ